ncbi:MAG: hypothetical protein ACKOU6_09330, partial [Planctomycetota bacterium]
VVAGSRWKIIDAAANRQYFVDLKDGQLLVFGEAQQFTLEPKTFALAAAGALLFTLPPYQESKTELFRLSGVFFMKINTTGLEIFVNAEMVIGPPGSELLRFQTLGVLIVGDRLSNDLDENGNQKTKIGFAIRFELSFIVGSSQFIKFEAAFKLTANTWGTTQEFRVPNLFLDPAKGYLSQSFINNLEFGTGSKQFELADSDGAFKQTLDQEMLSPALKAAFLQRSLSLSMSATVRRIYAQNRWEITDGDKLYVVQSEPGNEAVSTGTALAVYQSQGKFFVNIPRGPPQIDGTLGAPGFYIVASGMGKLTIADRITLEGAFRFEITENKLQLQVEARLQLGLPGGDVKAFGFLEVSSLGVIGILALDRDFSALRPYGLDVGVVAKLQVNTTNQAREVRSLLAGVAPIVVPAQSFLVEMAGKIIFLTPGTNTELFRLSGAFSLEISSNGFSMFVAADLIIGPPNFNLFTFHAAGLIVVNSKGFAVLCELTYSVGDPALLDFAINFNLQVNVTNEKQVYRVSDTFLSGNYLSNSFVARLKPDANGSRRIIEISAGVPQLDGSEGNAEPYVIISGTGSLTISQLITLRGDFRLVVSGSQLELEVNARVNIGVLGELIASGYIKITSDGLVASLQLSAQVGSPKIGAGVFSFSGRFQLEINTTNATQTIKRLNINRQTGEVSGLIDGTIPRKSLRVAIGGELRLVSIFVIKGQIELEFNSDGFQVSFDASLDLAFFGSLRVNGGAIIQRDVFVIGLGLGVNALSFGPFGLEGNFTLKVNTSSTARTVGGLTIPANTYQVYVDATLKLWVFEAKGAITIGVKEGIFEAALNNLSINFFNFVQLRVNGYIRSNGEFLINGAVSIYIPLGPFVLRGGFEITLADYGFSGRAYGSVSIEIPLPWPFPDIKITLASLEGRFEFRAATIRLGLTVSVIGIRFNGEIVWSFATPTLASKIGDTLYLNMGSRAANRGEYFDDDSAESYTISHESGGYGSETVSVSALGYTQSYSGIRKIVCLDAGQGNDTIHVTSGVLADVELNGGVGDDTLMAFTSGMALLRGGSGDDKLMSGSGHDVIYGDDGDDTIGAAGGNNRLYGGNGNDEIGAVGGSGQNIMYGGAGNDKLTGGSGIDILLGEQGQDSLDGGAGDDLLFGDLGSLPSTFAIGIFATNSPTVGDIDTINGGDGNDTIFGGAGNDEIYGQAGDDLIFGDFGSASITSTSRVGTLLNVDVGGDDYVEGNDGQDTIYGGQGRDILFGQAGNDVILGGLAGDLILGGADQDTINGNGGSDWIYGGSGDDSIFGDDGDDLIEGRSGRDAISGGNGNDLIYGDRGLMPLSDEQIANLNAGNRGQFPTTKRLTNLSSLFEDFLSGAAVSAGGDDDLLNGNAGDDIIVGGEGADTIDGQDGADLLIGDA